MKAWIKKGSVVLPILALLVFAAGYMRSHTGRNDALDTLLLLVPDSADPKEPLVQEWIDAAAEEGLHLELIRDSTLLNPMSRFHAAGLIIPDQIHKSANDALIGALYAYVHNGGKLLIVYDACTWDLNGHFPRFESRLSSLVGVDYALYDKFGKDSISLEQVWGNQQAMLGLEIPPGKFVPVENEDKPAWLQRVADPIGGRAAAKGPSAYQQDRFTFSRYLYNDLKYPSFRTSGDFDGKTLLESQAGLVAGYRKYNLGDVLFVNLPLGYLKLRTDGLLLHSFLRYFAVRILQLPYLAAVPDGTGGLIFNWHIDAESSLRPMAVLEKAGIFDQGPFSIDFTAGPDVNTFHDGKGMDVDNNREAQRWIKDFVKRGYAVGSHGGWIHNYFGLHINDANQREFEPYLALNQEVMERAVGGKMLEYSAPVGNHPEWVTRWLEKHGFIAYYFPGDSGMGPTRVYRDQGRIATATWAFPILHLGTEASFEEMMFDKVPAPLVQAWLIAIADFTANNHVSRLAYSHPFGATVYLAALQNWLRHTLELKQEGRFRWYTMIDIAEFMNTRKNVQWSIAPMEGKPGREILQASHPSTLNHQTWIFPEPRYQKIRVTGGSATVRKADGRWLVTAHDCKRLTLELDPS